jgi:hypothetical protein
MAGQIGDLLLRPDAFFRRLVEEPENLKIPALIVIAGGLIAAAAAYTISGTYAKMFEAAAGAGMASFIGLFGAISAFIGFVLIWWIIFAGVFTVISMAFKGSGSFRRTLQCTGYGLLPVVIGSVISLLVALYYVPMIQAPVLTSFSDPAAIQRAMEGVLQDPAFREFTLISTAISIIFLAWSANLWIFAMQHARSLPLRQAAITVLVPVIIYVVYVLFMALNGIRLLGGS